MNPKTEPYSAADFRFPVEVKRPTETPDGSGGFNVVWNTVIPVLMCAIENKTGREPYNDQGAGRIRTFQKFLFTTWWGHDIQQTDKLVHQGVQFNIRQVNNLHLRNKFMQIEAESGVEQ
jgi:head-tail adaptor